MGNVPGFHASCRSKCEEDLADTEDGGDGELDSVPNNNNINNNNNSVPKTTQVLWAVQEEEEEELTEFHSAAATKFADAQECIVSEQDRAACAASLAGVAENDGFFAVLDQSLQAYMHTYGIPESSDEAQQSAELQKWGTRIVTNDSFNGSCVLGAMLSEESFSHIIGDVPLPAYLRQKEVMPFLTLPFSLQDEKNGVQLMIMDGLDALLSKAKQAGMMGVKARSFIKFPNSAGIAAVLDQQLEFARRTCAVGLVPVLHMDVDLHSPDKAKSELMLVEMLMDGALDILALGEKVIFVLTLPKHSNHYLPLIRHPSTLRVMGTTTSATGGGYGRTDSCIILAQQVGMIACFGRAIAEGLQIDQSEEEFGEKLESSFKTILESCTAVPAKEEQLAKVSSQAGFIVGLDFNGDDTATYLGRFGVDVTGMSDEAMASKVDELLRKILTNPEFNGNRVLGAIFTQRFLNLVVDNMPFPQFLWEKLHMLTILKLEHSLKPERAGVCLMQEMKDLSKQINGAANRNIFAVQIRSVVMHDNHAGIKTLCKQSFDIGKKISEKGLVPYLRIEVDINAPRKAQCETMLFDCIMEQLGNLKHDVRVMLDLTAPAEPNTYTPLVNHPGTLRVTAHSGGYGREESCRLLSKNVGLIACLGRAFTEGLSDHQSPEEFSQTLIQSSKAIFVASMTIPIKEIQNVKIIEGEGFFAALDVGGGSQTVQLLLEYGVEVSSLSPKQQQGQLQAFRSRILTNPAINGSRAIAVAISDDFMRHEISGLPAPKYLWEVKQVVTFLKIDRGCQPEKDGMQLVKTAPKLDDLLAEAKDACIFGTKMKSVIKSPNEAGIEAVVKQQLALCRRVMAKDLVPCMQIEVDINATEKEKCEHLLCLALIDSLQSFNASEKVVLWLTLPNKPNSYLSLMGHPNVLRVVALSGGYDQPTAYGMVADNVGMIAGFGRTILGGLKVAMDDEEFTKVLTGTCDHMFQASRRPLVKELQMAKIAFQSGMLAAMDQSIAANTMQSGTVIPLLQDYGIGIDESTTKLEVLKHAHEMRLRMITSSSFNGSLVIGALLDEDTMTRQINRLLAAKYLWEQKSVVPLMKLDRGTLPEKDGVQLLNLKDLNSVLAAIDKAKTFGCLGVKTRAVIRLPNASGIKALVVQQFEVAGLILSKDMVPFLQLEVDLNSPDQGSCERILRQALMAQLRTLKQGEQVVLSMSLPSKAGIYNAFTEHPNVLRVAALSGGVKQRAACDKLAGNSGMVAAFGRALLEGALASQKEKEFSATLDKSIKMIVKASCSGPEATRAPSKEKAAAEAAA